MSQRFRYVRDDRKNPVACIATELSADKKEVVYALSILNPKDRFDRKLARTISLGRLSTRKGVCYLLIDNVNCHHINLQVMRDISERIDLPMRVRKAAKQWLVYAMVRTATRSLVERWIETKREGKNEEFG